MKSATRPAAQMNPAKNELKLRGKKDKRMTWEETFRDMARAKENWSDLEVTVADGIKSAQ